MYPWKTFVIEMLKDVQIPLWNPYNFSGSPLLANAQSAVFHPLNILYLAVSQPVAWSVSVISQIVVALVSTYLFAKKIGLAQKSAVLSSIAYSCSLYMSVFLEYNTLGHIIALLPLSLYAVETLFEKFSIKGLIIFVGSIVLAVFAGHIQIAGFNLMFILSYIFFRTAASSDRFKKMVQFGGFIILSFCIAAIQILPTIELIRFSARVSQDYNFLVEKLLIQPFQFILFFSPDFFGNPVTRNYVVSDSYPGNALYIGIVPILFAIYAVTLRRKTWHIKFFTSACIVLLLLFFRTPFSEIFYRLEIPFFSTGSPTNAIYILSLMMAIMAGYGLDYFEKNKENKRILLIALLILILIGINAVVLREMVNIKNALISSGILVVLIATFNLRRVLGLPKKILIYFLIIITVVDLFFYFQKFNPFVPAGIIFPGTAVFEYLEKNAGVNRVWGYGEASFDPNYTTQYKLFSPDGVDPLYPKWYGEFIQSSKNGKLAKSFTIKTRSDANISHGAGQTDLPSNKYRLKVLDMLGVAYILDKKNSGTSNVTFPEDRYEIVYQDEEFRIYKNLKAAPRAFFAAKIDFYTSADEFDKKFFNPSFNPAANVLLEESNRARVLKNVADNRTSPVLLSYSPNNVSFKTKSTSNELLFLSDTYYPGWEAWIDGKETEIIRANHAFRAIAVPKGTHTVTFNYNPASFSIGGKITIIGIVALVSLCALSLKKKKLW